MDRTCHASLVVASVIIGILTFGPVQAQALPPDVPTLFGRHADLVIGERDAGVVFGNATDIAIGRVGRVYVLDGGFGRVLFFSSEGVLLGDFGSRGEGPGEFTIPMSMGTDPSNGDVWIGNLGGRLCRYSADGEVIDDIRFSWPGSRPVRSIRIDENGLIYIACANVLDQTMIQVFTRNGELVRSFGDTFAIHRPETDTADELSYAVGFLDLRGDTILYTQKNPYEIRIYDLDGALQHTIGAGGQGVPYPPSVVQDDGRRIQRSLKGSWGIVATPHGEFFNNIVVPVSGDVPGHSVIERYNPAGELVETEVHTTPLFVRTVDRQNRVWALDNEPYARVMRYPPGSSESLIPRE